MQNSLNPNSFTRNSVPNSFTHRSVRTTVPESCEGCDMQF